MQACYNTNFIQQLPQSHHYHILHHDSHLLHHEQQHQKEEQPFLVPCIHHDLTVHVLLSLHNSCSDVLPMGWLLHNLESSSNSCIGHAHNSWIACTNARRNDDDLHSQTSDRIVNQSHHVDFVAVQEKKGCYPWWFSCNKWLKDHLHPQEHHALAHPHLLLGGIDCLNRIWL